MTNEIKTRRLIVTLPNCSGEEADLRLEDLEDSIAGRPVGETLPFNPGVRVRHALGETGLDGVLIRCRGDRIETGNLYKSATLPRYLTQTEARQLAGAFLAAADQLAEGTAS